MADEIVPHHYWEGRGKYPRNRKILPIPEFKKCKDCGVLKSSSDYYLETFKTKKGTRSQRLPARCKQCAAKWVPNVKDGYTPPALPEAKACSKCGVVMPISEFGIWSQKTSSGIEKKVSNPKCKSCCKSGLPRRQKKIWDLPASKVCLDCSSELPAAQFVIRAYQTSTGRKSRKLASQCLVCWKARRLVILYRRKAADPADIETARRAVKDTLDSYRIGDLYWDAYESKLIDRPTIDHVDPIRLGGGTFADNLTVTSARNNSSKGSLPLIVWMAKRAAREAAKKKV